MNYLIQLKNCHSFDSNKFKSIFIEIPIRGYEENNEVVL